MEIENCNLSPRGARVVVLTDEASYSGKLLIPESAKRRPTTGVILRAGPDVMLCQKRFSENSGLHQCTNNSCKELHIGDRVLYGQFSGTLVQMKGKPQYTLLGIDEILAKVEDESQLDYTAAG